MPVPHLVTYFDDFIAEIRISSEQRSALIDAHTTLRQRLKSDDGLADCVVGTFLQGSYKRSTIIKPAEGQASDVDVVVVTNFNEDEYTPEEALDRFVPFLEANYKGLYEKQGRSWGINLGDAEMDLVPTSAPSEADGSSRSLKHLALGATAEDLFDDEMIRRNFGSMDSSILMREMQGSDDWKNEPLRIPDRDAGSWEDTDPLAQINWTLTKNKKCTGLYLSVVKAIKWWWRTKHPDKKYPKGYPLEHLVGDCCPDEIESVAEGVVRTLENIVSQHPTKPFLPDRGLPENDVMARVSHDDYSRFYDAVREASVLAREAFDSEDDYSATVKWNELFGDEFPIASKPEDKMNFTARAGAATVLADSSFA